MAVRAEPAWTFGGARSVRTERHRTLPRAHAAQQFSFWLGLGESAEPHGFGKGFGRLFELFRV